MFSFRNYIILSIKGYIKKNEIENAYFRYANAAHVNINNTLFIVIGTIEICYYREN